MMRSWQNMSLAVLLIAVFASTCVFSCLATGAANTTAKSNSGEDPHACCHRNRTTPQDSSNNQSPNNKDCQNSTLELAKANLQFGPPAFSEASTTLTIPAPPRVQASRSPSYCPGYEPPDLLALHQTLLI